MLYFISKRLDQLQCLLDNLKTETSEVKENIKNNIIKSKLDIKNLEKNFETEKDNLLLYNKYNNQIINIRKHFSVSHQLSETIITLT